MIHRVWRSFLRFWETDRGLSVFLVTIVLSVFVLPALGALRILGGVLVDLFFTLLLLSGIASVSLNRRSFTLTTVVAVVALVLRWADAFSNSGALGVLDRLAEMTCILLFCGVIIGRVLKAGPITYHRIEGAVAAYLLLGLVWATGYELIEYLNPGSFAGGVAFSGTFSSWTYFSFVTLATLGYGDIVPVHPIARSLATAEAITGQLYLAILIARLVSQELNHRQSKEG